MGYIYVEKDGVQAQYLITSTAAQPRLVVGEHGYVPLIMGTTDAPMLKYAPADGYETLRAGSYTTTTVKSTSSSVGSSSVGCAGTSSSSGSTLNSTIQASTAISFTSTSAFTRVSTSGYNGLSNAQAQTCKSTSSWAGMSTRQSNYQTTLANSAGLSNVTALTRESVYAYSGLSTSSTTYNLAQTSRTITRVNLVAFTHDTSHMEPEYLYPAYPEAEISTINGRRVTAYRIGNDGYRKDDRYLPADQYGRTWDYVWEEYDNAGSQIGETRFRMSGSRDYVYDYGTHAIADGYSYSGTWSTGHADDSWGRTLYFLVSARTGYRTSSSEAACYITSPSAAGLSNVTNLTCASTSGWKGISSKVSSYTTTLANSAGLSNVTALTRSSTSAYSGISCSRSDYYGTQVNSNGMTNATAMTCESIYGYSGVTSRSSPYNTTSNAVGNLSYTTALVEPVYRTNTVTTAFSGVKFEYSYPVHSFVFGYYSANNGGYGMMYSVYGVDSNASYTIYDTVGDVIARNRSYASVWMPAYVDYPNVGEYIDIYFPDATNTKRNILNSYDIYSATGTGGPGGGGNTYTFRKTFTIASKTVTYTSTNMDGMRSATSLTGTVLGVIDHYNTTGYTGISSRQSNYNVTKENSAGLSNVTTLTRSSTSGYTGVLSRTSSYETLIPNDGQNALVAQALTCTSTSAWGGKSSTSESISSTELRTSYFTSGYTESTTISVTDRVLTTTIYSDTVTIQSSSLSSGNGYKIVGGAIVVDQGGYDYYTVESFSTYGQSTFVVVAESMETTTLRTSTYTRVSQAIMSYGARTSLSTYINTNTYIETIWGYM